MTSPAGAHALRRHNGTTVLTFPFRRWIVEELKLKIPASCLAYDPSLKAWTVTNEVAALAIQILKDEFGTVDLEYESPHGSEPTPIRRRDADYSELHLLPDAPAFVVEAVYRAMAKAHHPDCGGSTEAIKRLNLAYEALQAKAGAA